MNEALLIYLYLTAGNILKPLAFFIIVASAFFWLGIGVWYGDAYDQEGRDRAKAVAKKYPLKTVIFILVLRALYPSTADLQWIVGGATAWNVAENNAEQLEALPKNVLEATNSFLEGVKEDKE